MADMDNFGLGERPNDARRGITNPIGRDEVAKAEQTLKEYKEGKENLEARIVENELWYKLRHWEVAGVSKNAGDPQPTSAWLFNCIANKHADAMDNYPEPTVLPREAGDKEDAELLSSILPVVLEQNGYEETYSNMWWYKLKVGTGVTKVFWDASKNNGLGDIDIRRVDILNLFWEPGIDDLQKSRNIFHVDLIDNDLVEQQYPQLKGKLAGSAIDTKKYIYDENIDVSEKTTIVDWYYKVTINKRTILHFCKFCGGEVLYASENDPKYAESGFYDHGKYPFVFDNLFPEEGTPAGFGYVDICKSPQLYIDKLDQVILKHAVMGARPRFFARGDGKINLEEYADWSKDFVSYSGSGDPRDSIFPIEIAPLPEAYMSVRTQKIDELKETSGNRDFSQGGTASGVTAASAIAALQEAGSKLSRDMIKSSYRAFAQINYLCLELIRQFYQEDRVFRVVGKQGEMEFRQFSGTRIASVSQGNDFALDMGYRMPIFDIKVVSQKASPYSTVVQNERAKELYGLGFFRPDLADQALAALTMMQFEGIEQVRERVAQNGTLYQQVQQLQQQMMQMAAIIDMQNGSTISQGMAQTFAQGDQGAPVATGGAEVQTNSLGSALNASRSSTAGAARTRATRAAMPQ